MESAPTLDQPDQPVRSLPSERRCLVTGDILSKDELIRFVVGPEHVLVADLAQNLPGRGLWVTADRESITTAARKNLFAKAAKTQLKIPADLVDQVAALLHKRCLDFLGLARRSGMVVVGQPQVEGELKNGRLAFVLIATDAKTNILEGRDGQKNGIPIPSIRCFTRDELGAALGREQLAYVGLKADALFKKFQAELTRLEKMRHSPPITANQTVSDDAESKTVEV